MCAINDSLKSYTRPHWFWAIDLSHAQHCASLGMSWCLHWSLEKAWNSRFVFFLRQGYSPGWIRSHYVAKLDLNLQKSTCLCLWNAGIKGSPHLIQEPFDLWLTLPFPNVSTGYFYTTSNHTGLMLWDTVLQTTCQPYLFLHACLPGLERTCEHRSTRQDTN